MDSSVDSCPPCWVAVEVNTAAGLPTSVPLAHSAPSPSMKCFTDGLGAEWASGTLVGKPAAVFTSTATQHGGQESTLLSMQVPLLHHGCVIVGIPFTEPQLSSTRTGGTPYGASHVAGHDGQVALSEHEQQLALAQGKRLAEMALRLA